MGKEDLQDGDGTTCPLFQYSAVETYEGLRMLILEGIASALTALLGFWFLPDTVMTTRWLSEKERDLAQRRMESDRLVGAEEREPVKDALRHALADRRTWLFCVIQNFHYAGLSFINFLPT